MHHHHYRVWALPPWTKFGRFHPAVPWVVVLVYPSLGAPAIEFGHSRRVWAPLDGDDLYLSTHLCWVVSIIRHSGFYVQPRARTHELDLTKQVQT